MREISIIDKHKILRDENISIIENQDDSRSKEIAAVFNAFFLVKDKEENRKVRDDFFKLIKKADYTLYDFILSDVWCEWQNDYSSILPNITWDNIYNLCCRLYNIYQTYEDLEECLLSKTKGYNFNSRLEYINNVRKKYPYQVLSQLLFGGTYWDNPFGASANVRTMLVLKWLVCDLGLWQGINKNNLFVPLTDKVIEGAKKCKYIKAYKRDIHVCKDLKEKAKRLFPNNHMDMYYYLIRVADYE